MKKLVLLSWIYSASLMMPIIGLYIPRSSAEALWMSGATISEETYPKGLVNGGNLECEFFSLKTQYIYQYGLQNGRVNYADSTYEGVGASYPDVCMAQNQNGLVGTGFWAKDGNVNEALPIDAGPYTMMPAPGGNATLFTTPAPIYGMQYSINYNLPYLGYLGVKVIGSGVSQRSEKNWKIDSSKLEQFLTYSDGQIVRIDQVGFSSNGRYMAAQLSRRGVVLVDLETKRMTPFAPNTISNGTNMFMNVSNDGQYVAVFSAAGLSMHNLGGCSASYDKGQWPSTGILASNGCVSREYYPDVRSAYPLVTDISRLRFAPNGASLNIDVSWRDSSGELVAKRLRLSANGYTSTAKGYLAMGDSYSSGEGDTEGGTWYEPGTDEQGDIETFAGRNLCHLSRRSYPYLMAVELGYLSNNASTPPADGLFHSVACSGAKIHNIIGSVGEKQDDGNGSDFAITDNQYRFDRFQVNSIYIPGTTRQFNALSEKVFPDDSIRPKVSPEVITVGIGGNDAGFGNFLAACTTPGTCEFAQPGSKKSIDTVTRIAQNRSRLIKTYQKLKVAAPEARIYVHGYPKFIVGTGGYCAANVRLDDQERLFVENIIQYMNEVVKSAAQEAGVVYVDVEDIFERQELCSGAAQENILVNGTTAGNDVRPLENNAILKTIGIDEGICLRACIGQESYHPKSTGFVKYKDAILLQTNNMTTQMPLASIGRIPIPSTFFGSAAINEVLDLNSKNGFPTQEQALKEDLITGFEFTHKTMSAQLAELAPNSAVEIVVESTPTSLGMYTTDASGVLGVNIALPPGLEPGYHELHIIGKDKTGKGVDYYQPFIVGEAGNDFDGDGVLDDADSCPVVQNSGIDVDLDSVDDVCDDSPVSAVVPPEAPGIPDLVDLSDTGSSQTDNLTNDISPTFTVSCIDTNTVTIYAGINPIGTGNCLGGVVTITSVDLVEGQYQIVAKQTDLRGISSDISSGLQIVVDGSPPSSAGMPDLAANSDTGVSNTDNSTSDTTPTIIGTCFSDSQVELFVDGLYSISGVCIEGQYQIDLAALSPGTYAIAVSFTDNAGNSSTLSSTLFVTIVADEVDGITKGCRNLHSEKKKSHKPKNQHAPPVCILLGVSGMWSEKEDDKNDRLAVRISPKTPRPSLTVADIPWCSTLTIR